MKKIWIYSVLVMMLVSMVTTTGATSSNLQEKMKTGKISSEVSVKGVALEEVLALLSQQSGIRILAVPEIATLKVDLQIAEEQTLEQALTLLMNHYGLHIQMNDQKDTIIVLSGEHYDRAFNRGALQGMVMMNMGTAPMMSEKSVRLYASPAPYHPAVSFNTEEYKRVYDNNFQEALSSPVSTFSIDVDTASYSNMRRFINSGKLPPLDAVRTEEMINYFTYEYPQPVGQQPFSMTTEVGACPWEPSHKLVMIGLKGKEIQLEEMPASNLVFLIDVSGSMAQENKLPLLKTAFKMLVKQMREQDQVSIVVYAGAAGVVLEPTAGSEKEKIMHAIDTLQAGGSTAGGEGIQLAYKLAKENFIADGNNRVVLATDGDFNVGVSSEGELTRLIEEQREQRIFLSVLGFGMGNVKDNKMEALADKGNGNYAYIDNALEAKKVLVNQFAGTLYTIAKDVKLQVEFNPAQVKSYRLVGYENRVLDKSDFNNDKKDAGDMGAGHSVTAFYEIVPAGSQEVGTTVDPLVYQQAKIVDSNELLQIKVRYKKPNEDTSTLFTQSIDSKDGKAIGSENFRFAAAVAEYAMLLRNSEYKGQSSYQDILKLAKGAKGSDEEGYRAEFIKLVEISQFFTESESITFLDSK